MIQSCQLCILPDHQPLIHFWIIIDFWIQVPTPFVYVVTQTMREFFKAIQACKDAEPSWKKAIYKIIARLDELRNIAGSLDVAERNTER